MPLTLGTDLQERKEVLQSDLFSYIEHLVEIIFEECPEDFCIQYMGFTSIVFGGVNRVVWSIKNGLQIDKPYCSEKFIKHWEKVIDKI